MDWAEPSPPPVPEEIEHVYGLVKRSVIDARSESDSDHQDSGIILDYIVSDCASCTARTAADSVRFTDCLGCLQKPVDTSSKACEECDFRVETLSEHCNI